MSNNEFTPDNSSVGEQLPHSGVHGFEQPVREYKETTLREAVDGGLISTPEDVTSLIDNTPATEAKTQKDTQDLSPAPAETGTKRIGLKTKIGLFVAGLGLIGGGAAVATSGGESEAPAPVDPRTPTETTPTDTDTAPVVEEEPVVNNDFSRGEYNSFYELCSSPTAIGVLSGPEPSDMLFEAFQKSPQELINEVRRVTDLMRTGTPILVNGQSVTYDQMCNQIVAEAGQYL